MLTTEMKKLVAHVLVQTAKGYENGSGYVIKPGLILTCAHVLDKKGSNGTIEIRLCELESDKWIPASVAWDGRSDGDLDAVVLRFDESLLSDDSRRVCRQCGAILTMKQPSSDQRWESYGLPKSGYQTDRQTGKPVATPLDCRGSTGSLNPSGDLHLASDEVPIGASGWKGASGAAVFIDSSLSALIIETLKDRPGMLRALWIGQLLDAPEFKKTIGWVDVKNATTQVLNRVRDLLVAYPALLDALFESGNFSTKSADKIADEMLHTPVETLLALLDDVQTALAERGDVNAYNAVQSVVCHLLPFVFDYALISSLSDAELRDPMAFLNVPIKTQTISEIVSAGIDGRPVEFVRRGTKNPILQGTRLIPSVPECGFDKKKKLSIDSLKSDLARAVLDADKRASAENDAQLVDAIRAVLRVHASRKQKSRYYILVRGGSSDPRESAIATEIKKVIRELRVIKLEGGDISLETTLSTWLKEIFKNARQRGSSI